MLSCCHVDILLCCYVVMYLCCYVVILLCYYFIIKYQFHLLALILYVMNQMSQLSDNVMFTKIKGTPMKKESIFKTICSPNIMS